MKIVLALAEKFVLDEILNLFGRMGWGRGFDIEIRAPLTLVSLPCFEASHAFFYHFWRGGSDFHWNGINQSLAFHVWSAGEYLRLLDCRCAHHRRVFRLECILFVLSLLLEDRGKMVLRLYSSVHTI